MRRFIGLLLAVIIFLMTIQPVFAKQNDEPLKRLVLTLLAPKIQEQINQYYKNKLTVSPTFTPFFNGTDIDVKYYSSHIDVQVNTIPYVGPHLDVGIDSMRFSIDNSGSIMVQEYKHIKDYDLPPNWQEIITH
ncbi:DUF3888 domain-containing protein [Paenibacillus xylanexedens]|uniref:DUF3888 domain-containing protein n=1 Tax=Paenibacillus xylanexedens TaxID=528191 RepID=UPI0011A5A668|nr:DUF3888 domain-containing protein [Paenibacillus xylanexedens]